MTDTETGSGNAALPDYRALFHGAPALYVVIDRDMRVLAATDAYLRTAMLTRDEIVGRNLFDVFPNPPDEPDGDGIPNVRASIERTFDTGAVDAMAVQHHPIRRPESQGGGFEERHWSLVHHPVRDDAGTVVAVIHRVEDVTELLLRQKSEIGRVAADADLRARTERMEADIVLRAKEVQEANQKLRDANAELSELQRLLEIQVAEREEALRSSDERFRLLVEGVKEYAIFMLDRAGKVTSWSPAAERIKGYSEEEILGADYSVFFVEKDVAAGVPADELRRASETGNVVAEGWRLRKDRSRFWAHGVLTALYDSEGQVRGYAKVSRDMTEQRRTEVVLQSIVNTAIDGIITIDQHGTIQTFNRSAEKIFGYDAAEVTGQKINVLMPEPYGGEHDDYLESYMRTGIPRVIGIGREVTGRRKDGSNFPLELAVSQFELDGRPCFTGLVRDISPRRKMEEQLQQAQRMEAVGQLAAGVAHDFNNLLTVIAGYAELAFMTLDAQDKIRPMISEIRRAAERATSLTSQLLAFSRQQVLESKVFDLNKSLRETERMLQRLIGEDIQLVTILADAIEPVKADPGQVDQVVMNLALNARDAMPQGGRLTIETRNVHIDSDFAAAHPGIAAGRYVVMSVSDTGCGMTAKIRSRIFEPFFTTKGVGKGSGLGLSVIDGIVRQSGGHVDVYSEVDVGSVFKVYLPAAPEAETSLSGAPQAKNFHGVETILLVEDDASVRGLAVAALEQFGYAVLEASGGPEALRLLERRDGRIDLLVTDVVMPEMSGRKVAEAVLARYPGVKVLYMSGYTDDSVVRHGILQAEIDFLQKPFTPATLVKKVREVLDKE
ncbi:MAG: PAS domain S-box protein [Candidatus Binatia bacterium]